MAERERKEQIAESLRELVRAYTRAMARFEDTLAVLCKELELGGIETIFEPLGVLRGLTPAADDSEFPIVDRTLLSVRWRGRSCFLGNTLPLKFFERLARRPNQYFSYEQLLDEVWEEKRSFSAIRSVVMTLRRKLAEAGMADLADTIDGSVYRHYGLMLDKKK